MYDNEVIDEEVFLRWKEEVNEQYPGKGKALFQVGWSLQIYREFVNNFRQTIEPLTWEFICFTFWL